MIMSPEHREEHYIPLAAHRLWCHDCKDWQLYEDVVFWELSCRECGSTLLCDECGTELRQDRRCRTIGTIWDRRDGKTNPVRRT